MERTVQKCKNDSKKYHLVFNNQVQILMQVRTVPPTVSQSQANTLTLLLRVSTAGNFLTINLTADSKFLSTR